MQSAPSQRHLLFFLGFPVPSTAAWASQSCQRDCVRYAGGVRGTKGGWVARGGVTGGCGGGGGLTR